MAALSFVQNAYANVLSGLSTAVAYATQNLTVGSFLISVLLYQQSAPGVSVTSVADNSGTGNTWTRLAPDVIGAVVSCSVWYCAKNNASSKPTVTATLAGGAGGAGTPFAAMQVYEYTGQASSSPVDVVTSGNQDVPLNGNMALGPITPTQTNESLFTATVLNSGGGTQSADPNYTVRGTHTNVMLADETLATPSSQSATPTQGAVLAWAGFIFAVKSTSSAIPSYSISGNAGVAGATVSYTGTSSGNVTADGSGNYTIPSLVNGSYTITPSLAGYTFSPTNQSETVSGSNITGVNFTATSTGGGSQVNWISAHRDFVNKRGLRG
jgi:hypothetical protein